MMHVTHGGKSVLMDDDAATTLLDYAAVLGHSHDADIVNVAAVNSDGNTLTVTYLLNENSELTAETTTSDLSVPANTEAVSYMRRRMEHVRRPPVVEPEQGFEPPAVPEL